MSIKTWLERRNRERFSRNLEAWLKQNSLNQEALLDLNSVYAQDWFTYRVQENFVWSTGDSHLIRYFYTQNKSSSSSTFFWRCAPTDSTILRHCGIPKLSSNAMANILMGKQFETDIKVYNLNELGEPTEEVNDATTNDLKDELNILFDKTNLMNTFHAQAFIDSWCGHSFLKFSYDLSLSNYPIVEVFDLTKAKVIKERGITTAIVFTTFYDYKDKKYQFDETYTTDDAGDATIINALYLIGFNKKEKVALTTIPETAELLDSFTFTGLKGMLAFEKPNKLPNAEFPNSYYGASDYQGAIDTFDSLDEVYSEFIYETRNNKTMRYIPNSMIERDSKGNPILSSLSWVNNYVKVESDQDQGASSEISIVQIPDKTESLKSKYDKLLCLVLNHMGLSPLAIGTTGLEAINASDNSQKERNRVSVETRKAKLTKYWTPYLKNMLTQLLSFNHWLINTAGANQPSTRVSPISFDNLDINFNFGEFVVENPSEVYSRVASAKSSGIMSIEQAVALLHPEWTKDQRLSEVNLIKFENNIGVDSPDLLQFDESEVE